MTVLVLPDPAAEPQPDPVEVVQPLDTSTTRAEVRRLRDERSAAIAAELGSCGPQRDVALRAELVVVNMPIASALAGRYRHRGEAFDDLEQVAFVGLSGAARRFDPTLSNTFASFCVPTVLGELRRHFRDRGWVVRPPRRVQELQPQVYRAQRELAVAWSREPTVSELAGELGCRNGDVEEALTVGTCYQPTSLDGRFGAEDGSIGLAELLPSATGERDAAEARMVLGPLVRKLGDRDRRVLQLRFFEGLTQREIGEDLGVTQMQVSRLLTHILDRLRSEIEGRHHPRPPG